MCEFCLQHTCPAQCPNADEPETLALDCGCEIEEGEAYYSVNDYTICEDCLSEARRYV